MKADVILQARSTSTRLPGKIFMELRGLTMLEQILIRLKKVSGVRHVCVATIRDDYARVRDICRRRGCRAVWGSEPDVLGRFVKAARVLDSAVVIRTTADNPLVDYEALALALREFHPSESDALVMDGLPYGAGFEILSAQALRACAKKAKKPEEREHVTPYLYAHPEFFRVKRMAAPEGHNAPGLRVTVDTPEDYACAEDYYARFFDEAAGTADLKKVISHGSPGSVGILS